MTDWWIILYIPRCVLSRITFACEYSHLFKNLSGRVINSSKTEGMWIGSSRDKTSKPFGIKWPDEPIKALGVYYSYDIKLLHEKNFIERLDSVKKLLNIWSSRGLSIYVKVTIIRSLIIPKFVYISSILPVPKEIIKELNQMIFKFLWKGTDKVTRLSTINKYENGGLKMIDLESMIKSLRLAWLKRIFQCNNGAWRNLLRFSLEPFGGLFFFHCNYDIKEIHISSKFYPELLGLSLIVFSIVEGNVNIFCGITKRYVLIVNLFSIKNVLNKTSFS